MLLRAHEKAQRVLDELRKHPDGLHLSDITQHTGLGLRDTSDGVARLIRDRVCEVSVPPGEDRRIYALRVNADDYTPRPRGSL